MLLHPIGAVMLAGVAVSAVAAGSAAARARPQAPPPTTAPDDDDASARASAAPIVIQVFEREVLHWDPERPEIVEADGHVVRHAGQTVDRIVDLPDATISGRRLVATVELEIAHDQPGPETSGEKADGPRPLDPWTRFGSLIVVVPGVNDRPREVELMRFVSGYGAGGTYTADLTAFAPILRGRTTLRAFLSTYADAPAWRISVRLAYEPDGAGQRRPALAEGLFFSTHVTAAKSRLTAVVRVPEGLGPPRLRILATGHATDGGPLHEFVSCPHTLLIDGRRVAVWRPWAERGGTVRAQNPWAGRRDVDGRELWSSDLDRTGWHPGLLVEPLIIPLADLGPGQHRIEIRIDGIRPPAAAGAGSGDGETDASGPGHHGYWALSAVLLADRAWPDD